MRRLWIVTPLAVLAAALLVGGAAAFGFGDPPPPAGAVGQSYSYQFNAREGSGCAPFTYVVDTGGLPPGLGLSSSGLLSGVPTQGGSFNFFLDASYVCFSNPRVHSQRQFTVNVAVGLVVQQASLPTLVQGAPFSLQLTASGGGTQAWSVASGVVPTGIGLAANGLLSGTPTAPGRYEFTVRVTDGSRTDDQAYTVDVIEALVATAPAVPVAVVGSDFNLALTATGGRAPYTWTIQDGSTWVRGLAFAGGVITGRPRAAGSYAAIVVVTDALGNSVTVPLPIVVNARLKIPLQVLKPGVVGRAYRAKIATKGGAAPLRFEIDAGDPPRGVRLNAGTGVLTGKPRLKGRYAFTVVVVDQLGNTHRRAFLIRVR